MRRVWQLAAVVLTVQCGAVRITDNDDLIEADRSSAGLVPFDVVSVTNSTKSLAESEPASTANASNSIEARIAAAFRKVDEKSHPTTTTTTTTKPATPSAATTTEPAVDPSKVPCPQTCSVDIPGVLGDSGKPLPPQSCTYFVFNHNLTCGGLEKYQGCDCWGCICQVPRDTTCLGWSPSWGEHRGKGASCQKWGWKIDWCFVSKDYSGPGAKHLQESGAYDGKYWAPCGKEHGSGSGPKRKKGAGEHGDEAAKCELPRDCVTALAATINSYLEEDSAGACCKDVWQKAVSDNAGSGSLHGKCADKFGVGEDTWQNKYYRSCYAKVADMAKEKNWLSCDLEAPTDGDGSEARAPPQCSLTSNAALHGYAMPPKLTDQTVQSCMEACDRDIRCKSFNWERTTYSCELNRKRAGEEGVADLSKNDQGNPFDYYDCEAGVHSWLQDYEEPPQKKSLAEEQERRTDACSGWWPSDGEFKSTGSSCRTWDQSSSLRSWCWVEKDYTGPGVEHIQPSRAYDGKYWVSCEGTSLLSGADTAASEGLGKPPALSQADDVDAKVEKHLALAQNVEASAVVQAAVNAEREEHKKLAEPDRTVEKDVAVKNPSVAVAPFSSLTENGGEDKAQLKAEEQKSSNTVAESVLRVKDEQIAALEKRVKDMSLQESADRQRKAAEAQEEELRKRQERRRQEIEELEKQLKDSTAKSHADEEAAKQVKQMEMESRRLKEEVKKEVESEVAKEVEGMVSKATASGKQKDGLLDQTSDEQLRRGREEQAAQEAAAKASREAAAKAAQDAAAAAKAAQEATARAAQEAAKKEAQEAAAKAAQQAASKAAKEASNIAKLVQNASALARTMASKMAQMHGKAADSKTNAAASSNSSFAASSRLAAAAIDRGHDAKLQFARSQVPAPPLGGVVAASKSSAAASVVAAALPPRGAATIPRKAESPSLLGQGTEKSIAAESRVARLQEENEALRLQLENAMLRYKLQQDFAGSSPSAMKAPRNHALAELSNGEDAEDVASAAMPPAVAETGDFSLDAALMAAPEAVAPGATMDDSRGTAGLGSVGVRSLGVGFPQPGGQRRTPLERVGVPALDAVT
eukprot:TRINITY_DN34809_c0_g1_i1.p1 TRINITY_DN34809_c0_g1~~TRINITY_DN34809_c0_g1_i1.p1  ORF type:complete len:1091 (+),score=318.18 TRINITY_DN34809_c0_g1_i1:99-3371(+)